MKALFLIRLGLDFSTAGLLLVALAYYWLSNAVHEFVGTGIFLLLLSHNLFNHRWWGGLAKGRLDTRTAMTKALNMSLLITMLSLLLTSVLISQTVFSFLPITSTAMARQLHSLAAYWALVIVAVHLGWHWSMIMGVVANRLGVGAKSPLRTAMLRLAAAAVAACGLFSWGALDLSSKLFMQVTMFMWDFRGSTPAFFLHHLAVIGLLAVIAHYALAAILTLKRVAGPTARGGSRLRPEAE